MAKNKLRDFHVFAMESALPFGMGIMKNAKRGRFQKIMNALKSKDQFSELQIDGEPSAKIVKDKIDQIIPGLGYPVISVDVNVKEKYSNFDNNDQDSLVSILNRIDSELDKLRHYFSNGSIKRDNE